MALKDIFNAEAFGLAVVPTMANAVFNMFNVIFDSLSEGKLPGTSPLAPSVYDTAIGSAFAMIGIYVTTKAADAAKTRILLAFCGLLILIVGANCAKILFHLNRLVPTLVCDLIAFAALMWSLTESKAPLIDDRYSTLSDAVFAGIRRSWTGGRRLGVRLHALRARICRPSAGIVQWSRPYLPNRKAGRGSGPCAAGDDQSPPVTRIAREWIAQDERRRGEAG